MTEDMVQEAVSPRVDPIGTSAEQASHDREGRNDEYRRLRRKYAAIRKVARQIIRLRSEFGMTQQELAERVGTSYSQISRLEGGRHKPSFETLERIAAAFGREINLEFAVTQPEASVHAESRAQRPSVAAAVTSEHVGIPATLDPREDEEHDVAWASLYHLAMNEPRSAFGNQRKRSTDQARQRTVAS